MDSCLSLLSYGHCYKKRADVRVNWREFWKIARRSESEKYRHLEDTRVCYIIAIRWIVFITCSVDSSFFLKQLYLARTLGCKRRLDAAVGAFVVDIAIATHWTTENACSLSRARGNGPRVAETQSAVSMLYDSPVARKKLPRDRCTRWKRTQLETNLRTRMSESELDFLTVRLVAR